MKQIISYKRSKKSKTLIALLILLVVLAIDAAGLAYYNSINVYKFKISGAYYVNGIDYYIAAGDKATVDRHKNVTVKRSFGDDIADPELGVFLDDNTMVVLQDMAYYKSNMQGRVYATQIHPLTSIYASEGAIKITKSGKQLVEQGNFLFDGLDSYVVLRDCTLRIGDRGTLNLSALSYVICGYSGYVMYWDHDSNSFAQIIFEDYESNMVDIEFDDGIIVQCNLDRFVRGEESQMLSSVIDMLTETF